MRIIYFDIDSLRPSHELLWVHGALTHWGPGCEFDYPEGDGHSETVPFFTNGKGVDVAWETAGHPAALQSALGSLRRGGKLAVVGLPPQDEIPLNVPLIADNEIDIYGVFRYANTY